MKPCLTSIVVLGALFLGEATMCGQEGETAQDNASLVWAVAGMVTVVAVAIPLSTLEHTAHAHTFLQDKRPAHKTPQVR